MGKIDLRDIRRKNPINRNNLFASDKQYDFQVSIGMEYVNKVINQTVVLYEVDQELTKLDDIYNESNFNNLIFKQPVEINVLYLLDKAELKTYDTNYIKGYYLKVGKLKFNVYEKELSENECDIHRGDYIGLQVNEDHMEFFIVTDDGRINYDNAHTVFGIKPYYRTIMCTSVGDVNETKNI